VFVAGHGSLLAQDTPQTGTLPVATTAPQPKALDDTIEAGEAEAKEPARSLVKWNHYEGQLFSIRLGGGVLLDYATYAQDANSQQQFDLTPEFKVRDARMLAADADGELVSVRPPPP